MKLENVKENINYHFRVGFDKISNRYLLETDDTFGNYSYFCISEEQYLWYGDNFQRLVKLVEQCIKENSKSDLFFFSNWERENTYEQNKIMWKYMYIDMFMEKDKKYIHEKIGTPNSVINTDDQITEVYRMSNELEIQIVFLKEICKDVLVKWNEKY